jgi:hypothetical protein
MKQPVENTEWFCPLYEKDIAEGKCLDINYERLGYMTSGCLAEVTRLTGKREPEISRTCESCPNLPITGEFKTRTRKADQG